MQHFAFILSAILVVMETEAFPENLTPVMTYEHVSTRVFNGGDDGAERRLSGVQTVKSLQIAGVRRIAVASRENLFFLAPQQFSPGNTKNISYTEVYTWKSTDSARDLCLMKGQPQELCYNYLSVLETPAFDHLLLCGTNSYDPLCASYKISVKDNKLSLARSRETISGKQRSPFGPNQPSVSLFTGDSLYSATFQSVFGGLPVISRTMGNNIPLRTTTTSPIMHDPQFVKMIEDEKRILVYFNEIQELGSGEKRTIAQVAQVCKNDKGGDRVLQRSFTTFIKSRLNCSYNGYFLDRVNDVTEPVTYDGQTVIFATFATSGNSLAGSAVCSFTMSSIYASLTGPFQANDHPTSEMPPPAAPRHPGSCPEERLTDEELVFLKSHPQMEKHVNGSLLLTNQGQRWTAVQVDAAAGPDHVTVLYIGTENGRLIRALAPSSSWPHGAVISEENVFDEKRCVFEHEVKRERHVLRILLEDDSVLVVFKHCIVTLPLRSCFRHQCESACRSSADPYCGWDGSACVPFRTPNPLMKQDIESALRGESEPCQDETVIADTKATETATKKVVTPKSLPDVEPRSAEDVGGEQGEVSEELSYAFADPVLVALVTCLSTVVLMILILTLSYVCCCKKKKLSDEEAFKKIQMEQIHHMALGADEKRGSLTQRARQTYYGLKDMFMKVATPVSTPQVLKRDGSSRRRSHNNYTQAPDFRKAEDERADMRMSVSSRQDGIDFCPVSQPLFSQTPEIFYPVAELTLPRYAADAPTLRMPVKPTGDSPPLSSSYPTRSGSGSPFSQESGAGAAECGVLQTASAKLRRRNERATSLANEIMRDSDSGLREYENTLLRLQEHGLAQATIPSYLARQRLDSGDSGKGESPRNSLPIDVEQRVTSRPQRPLSLNVQRSTAGKRQRLLSEGSHPANVGTPVSTILRSTRERHGSGHSSNRSQPSTPVGCPQRLSLCQPIVESPNEPPLYSSLPHPHSLRTDPGCRKLKNPETTHLVQQTPPHHAHFQPSTIPASRHPQHLNGVPKKTVKLQRHLSECHKPLIGHDAIPWTADSPSHVSVNYYPSLRVRGPHAQRNLFPHPQQKAIIESPSKNFYPSLPHRSTSNPYGHNNMHVTSTGFERPATIYKREKLPSLMRQASVPVSTNPGLFVPPPTVPNDYITYRVV